MDILSEKVIGFEALIRWQHPTRGLISPAEFIPVAEEEELIVEMSEWVIKSVTQQQRIWHKKGLAPTDVSINLSGLHFRQRNIASHIKGLVFAEGGNPQDIELELTESVLMTDAPSTAATLKELKESGFRLAIDDFGTGYSSLAYLQRFPIDTIKIDQAFLKDLKLGKVVFPHHAGHYRDGPRPQAAHCRRGSRDQRSARVSSHAGLRSLSRLSLQ